MSNYTKTVDFAAKDNLPPGNPAKAVKGADVGLELDSIATAVNSKQDTVGAVTTSATNVFTAVQRFANPANGEGIRLGGTGVSDPYISFYSVNATRRAYIQNITSSGVWSFVNEVTGADINLLTTGGGLVKSNGNKVATVAAETITGTYSFTTRPRMTGLGYFLSHANASNTGGSITITSVTPTDTTGMAAGDMKFVY